MSSENSSAAPTVAIAGVAGRMGRQLVGAALDNGFNVVGGTEIAGSPHLDSDIGVLSAREALGVRPVTDVSAAARGAGVWVDFTRPAATLSALDHLADLGVKAAIIGTTGFSEEDDAAIRQSAERLTIVKAGNFSIGINLLEAMTRLAAARLDDGWDIEILETHHRRKVDAPSGTALMLGEAAARARGEALGSVRRGPYDGPDAERAQGQIGFAVRRSGGVIGEHEVTFGSDREVIGLSHTALDRSVFADGAIKAARWALSQGPGLYGMDHVLGFAAP